MRKLYRSRRTKLLGGVAAGFAEYFAIDVTIMRLLFALVAVTVPSSVLAYVLAWIIIPEDPHETATAPRGTPVPKPAETQLPPTADEVFDGKAVVSAPAQPGIQVHASGPVESRPVEPERNRQLFGYILIIVGVVVLAKRFVPSFLWRLPSQVIGQAWPVLIIVVGAALIFGAIRGR